MFLGHFAVGFAAKRAAPAASLGTFFLAGQFADLLWPNLVLAGAETFSVAPGATEVTPLDFTRYPYSHSLLFLLIWGLLIAGLHFWRRRSVVTATVLAALVLSHWLLDVASHRPDMPLAPGSDTRLGFGLWDSLPGTLLVEGLLFAGGLAVYLRTTRASDRTGTLALWAFVAFLTVAYLGNLFGPPPPSVSAVAWSAQAMWLLVAWGYWIDRHREVRLSAPPDPQLGRTEASSSSAA